MTTESPTQTQVTLHLSSFDTSGLVVTNHIQRFLTNWQEKTHLWLILEQMHMFDFEGPDVNKIRPLITADSIGTYGLRGRVFWNTGQIEWRRLSPDTVRMVMMSENTPLVAAPNDIQVKNKTRAMFIRDGRLILWGESRDGGDFFEQRVAGSEPIGYPAQLRAEAGGKKGSNYIILPFRTYIDHDGIEQYRRFLPPTVTDEESLKKTIAASVQQPQEVHNG